MKRPIKASPSKALPPPGAQLNEEARANLQGEGSSFCVGRGEDAFEHAQEIPMETCAVSAGGQRGAMALLCAQGELPLSVICCPTPGSLSIRQRTLPLLDNPLICSAPGKGPQAPAPGYRSRGMEVGTGGQQGALTFGSECSGHRHQRARASSPFISTRLP